jgi:pilus assembly protein TadC
MANVLVTALVRSNPQLRRLLRVARLHFTAEEFVARNLRGALLFAGTAAVLLFMLLDKFRGRELLMQNFLIIVLAFMLAAFVAFQFLQNSVTVYIRRQERELNKDVVFVGRYLLIKLQSGVPFYQALADGANGEFGAVSRYLHEIVDDIELGTPIEQALSTAADLSPSQEFRQILWQINTALRSGVDVTTTLRSILNEVAGMQIIQIEAYGKRLGSLSLFYMLLAVIMPSLGLTLFVAFSGFMGLQLQFIHLMGIVGVLALIQLLFMSVFRSIRPQINL